MCDNIERQDQEGLYQPLRTSFTKVFCQNIPDRDTGGATQSYLPRPSKTPHILTIFEGQMLVGQRSTQRKLDPETEGSSASSLRVCTRPVWPLWRTKAARTMDEQSRIDPVNISVLLLLSCLIAGLLFPVFHAAECLALTILDPFDFEFCTVSIDGAVGMTILI